MRRHRDGERGGVHRGRWLLPAVLVVAWLGLGGVLGPLAGGLGDVSESGAAAYLPAGAEATEAIERNAAFSGQDVLPGVLVYERAGGLTGADRAAIEADVDRIGTGLGNGLAGPPAGPVLSQDGEAAQVILPFVGSDRDDVGPAIERLDGLVGTGAGPTAHLAGPAGAEADIGAALGAIDLVLVLVTSAVIVLILVVVYRSPLLPLLVLAVAGTALGVTQGVLYLLVDRGLLGMGAEVQGILSVLVLGCATDYALLLVARYREELRRHASRYTAMAAAWRSSAAPIAASAGTVGLGLLCLLVSDLGVNSYLGPAGAIGVASALLAMLTFLPALLVLFGRAAFWPGRVACGAPDAERTGGWPRVAGLVARRPRLLWVSAALGLAVLSLAALRLDAGGIPQDEQIVSGDAGSQIGQQVIGEHFPEGIGNPAIVIARADAAAAVADAARGADGVAAVAPYAGGGPGDGPVVRDGQVRFDVTLDSAAGTAGAADGVRALRDAVHGVPGADAVVGGETAVSLDFRAAAEQDRIVIPLLLGVVFVLVALLLRALVAPLLLVATVVLSFLAAIGTSAVVFQEILGFPSVDSTFPLHAFVFLVALGVDYNIFLISRVREESVRHGTRRGTVRGLIVTGGVITSAGIVLAATFSALALVPLVLMVQLAFVVAFGVLLDTLVVRSVLVPALVLDVGRWFWWPSSLARTDGPAVPPGPTDQETGSPAGRPLTGVPAR